MMNLSQDMESQSVENREEESDQSNLLSNIAVSDRKYRKYNKKDLRNITGQ